MRTLAPGSFVLVTLLATGCGAQDPDLGVAEQATTIAETSADAVDIAAYLEVGPALAEVDVGGFTTAIGSVRTLLERDKLGDCVTIDTDGLTYVDITFAGCGGRLGRSGLDGTLHGELSLVTATCGDWPCVTGIAWDVDAALVVNDATIDGSWVLLSPIDPSAPRGLTGAMAITGRNGVEVSARSTASWTGGACIDLDLAAELETPDRTATVSVTDLQRCAGGCPTAGDVEVAIDDRTLSWTYDGDETALVTGSRGQFAIDLACTP